MDKKIKCSVILLLIGVTLFIPMFWHIFKQSKTVLISFTYSDDHIDGIDQPIANMPIDISIDGVFSETVYTDGLGQIQLSLADSGNYTYLYNWQNVNILVDIDDTQSSTITHVLNTWTLDANFIWNDLTPIVSQTLDLLVWNGSSFIYLTSVNTDGLGRGNLSGLFIGQFKFENQNETFSIVQNSEYDSLPTEINIALKCAYIS